MVFEDVGKERFVPREFVFVGRVFGRTVFESLFDVFVARTLRKESVDWVRKW